MNLSNRRARIRADLKSFISYWVKSKWRREPSMPLKLFLVTGLSLPRLLCSLQDVRLKVFTTRFHWLQSIVHLHVSLSLQGRSLLLQLPVLRGHNHRTAKLKSIHDFFHVAIFSGVGYWYGPHEVSVLASKLSYGLRDRSRLPNFAKSQI